MVVFIESVKCNVLEYLPKSDGQDFVNHVHFIKDNENTAS